MYQDDCFTPKKSLQRTPPGKENFDVCPTGNKGFLEVNSKRTAPLGLNKELKKIGSDGPDSTKKVPSANATTPPMKKLPSSESSMRDVEQHNEPSVRQVQASCFTPQKSLKRSPPSQMDMTNAVPPIHRWELPRTPVAMDTSVPLKEQAVTVGTLALPNKLPHTPDATAFPISCKEPPRALVTVDMLAPPISHKEIPRTPVTTAPPTMHLELPCVPAAVDMMEPPISHKEIPRTPVAKDMSVPPTSHKEVPNTPVIQEEIAPPTSPAMPPEMTSDSLPSRCQPSRVPVCMATSPHIEYVQLSPARSSPARIKPPRHPLCQSSRASLAHSSPSASAAPRLVQGSLQPAAPQSVLGSAEDQGGGARRLKSLATKGVQRLSESQVVTDSTCQEKGLPSIEEESSSPPIAISKGTNALPGLKCTEEDLAFLQRIDNLKQYKALQAQKEHLLKQKKSISEEKEQLEHTAIKVKRDLDKMKAKCQDTVSTASDLMASLSLLVAKSDSVGEHHLEPTAASQETDLNQAKVARLKKLAQLGSVQVERIDTKLKAKLSKLENDKLELNRRIRQAKDRDLQRRTELESKIEALENEKALLERKWESAVDKNTSAEAEIESLQSQLAKLELSSKPNEPQVVLSEKQRAEERLKMIALQCELCVQRHEMQKKLKALE